MRGVQGAVATALARIPPLCLSCTRATFRRPIWRCFPAPAAAGAAGARGEHPAAGAASADAFLERGAGTIARSVAAKIPGVLGGFQKLIALKASDPQGFDLLNSIMEHMPPESVDWYRKQVFILLFQRLPNSKPTKLIKRCLKRAWRK
ncbi:exportin-2-like [Pithys albifrons albifrons]|uniref:exportin-2-like n=1 Tax=Pithys albifrons albifrons TaxID=3385563 RepID=UPI003A5CE230